MSPLRGLRLLDFTAHAAGPFCTHILSQFGMECIKVESAARPDIFRRPHPVYGRMTAASFDQVSANKRSIRLNLKHPEASGIALRLAALSDAVAESFRPGVVDRLGVGYASMRSARSDIVMVSISASGQSGPDARFSGYAPMFGAWGSLGHLTGYTDGPPVEMRHVMDHTVGLHAAFATAAALLSRQQTGMGRHVDVSARDVAATLAGDALLRAAAGDHPVRMGNEQPGAAPHGLYPTDTPDRWVAISIQSEEAWRGLLDAMRRPDLARDPRFGSGDRRYEHRHELDDIVAAWSCDHPGDRLVAALQGRGVPAHLSMTAADLAADEHLRARGLVVDTAEPDGSMRAAVGSPIRFSRTTDCGIRSGTPELGEAEDYVYGELLGMSSTERARLVDDHAIF